MTESDITNNFYSSVVQCKSCNPNCHQDCRDTLRKNTHANIQNQVSVSESLKMNVLNTFTIYGPTNNILSHQNSYLYKRSNNRNWSTPNNLRNQSDRLLPSRSDTNNKSFLYTNISTRGSSINRTITSNRPGAMNPGGIGVDVKHGSYTRYLSRLKAKNITSNKMGPFDDENEEVNGSANKFNQLNKGIHSRVRPATNNKLYRFTIINTNNCCPS